MFERSQIQNTGPDALCVGMPKCGTSTLHVLLRDYTDVYAPPFKEVKFLAADAIGYHGGIAGFLFKDHWAARQERKAFRRIMFRALRGKGDPGSVRWTLKFTFARRNMKWYRSLFPEDRASLDISPAYHMLGREEISRIQQAMPHLRILIMLRNPYDQLWSHCRMSARGHDNVDEAAFFREQLDYQLGLVRSYADLVQRWQDAFGDRVEVHYLEELKEDPNTLVRKVVDLVTADRVGGSEIRPIEGSPKVFGGKRRSIPETLKPDLLDAARQRLDGFEKISPVMTRKWHAEIDARD